MPRETPSPAPEPVSPRSSSSGALIGDHQRTLLRLIAAAVPPPARTQPQETASASARTAASSGRSAPRLTATEIPPDAMAHPAAHSPWNSAIWDHFELEDEAENNRRHSDRDSDSDGDLLAGSLRAGHASRQRRRSRLSLPNPHRILEDSRGGEREGAGEDQLVDDSGWLFLAATTSAGPLGAQDREISPEERRAMRSSLLARADWRIDDDTVEPEQDDSRAGGPHWNPDALSPGQDGLAAANDPLSIPRTSALPRGGRRFSPPRTSTFAPTIPTAAPTAVDPIRTLASGPSQPESSSQREPERTSAVDRLEGRRAAVHNTLAQLRNIRRSAEASQDEALSRLQDGAGTGASGSSATRNPRDGSSQLGTTTSPGASDRISSVLARHGVAPWRSGEGPPAAAATAQPAPTRRELAVLAYERTLLDGGGLGSDSEDEIAAGAPLLPTWSGSGSPRRRTREDTNALMGAALRSKKYVWVLYCGNDGSAEGERLPAGFSRRGDAAGALEEQGMDLEASRGCGALVCSRALLEGVPDKVFRDGAAAKEQGAASSDLPPCADKVADLDGDGVGQRVGARGGKKCKGCVTYDIACTRCGNILGYRLLRPCVVCSISRPTYRTYASAVSNDPNSPNGAARPVLSAGGVTGGGVVDGLLFNYRLASVTALPRRFGIRPLAELPSDADAFDLAVYEERVGEGAGDEADPVEAPRVGRLGPPAFARLREKAPQVGDKMIWKHIPSAQRDFEAGLVGEPSDWISPSSETWWLDHAIVKHSRKRTAGAAFADSNDFNPDSLSSARTSAGSGGGSAFSSSGSPLRSSLSRSHAMRVRVPLSNAHPSSAVAETSRRSGSGDRAETAAASYDRFRHDATDFARRVRQRLADPSASDSSVVASLARAGYGSGFASERRDDEATLAGGGPSRSGREVVGR